MDPGIYKLLHFIGVILLLLGLGGALSASHEARNKFIAIFHGLGALLVVVSGFGLQAKAHGGTWPSWMLAKIAIWFLLAGILVVLKRRMLPEGIGWALVALLAGVAAYLGLSHSVVMAM